MSSLIVEPDGVVEKLQSPNFWEQDSESFIVFNSRLVANTRQAVFQDWLQSLAFKITNRNHIVLCTSGSTGQPSWVALSKKALLINAAAVNSFHDLKGHHSWANFLPLFHVGAVSIFARAHLAGSKVKNLSNKKWNAKIFFDVLAEESFSLVSLVPTQVYDLVEYLESHRGQREYLKNLKGLIVGGARLETSVANRLSEWGVPFSVSYGMTETSSQVSASFLGDPTLTLKLHKIWSLKTGLQENETLISGSALATATQRNGVLNGSFQLPDEIRSNPESSGEVSLKVMGRRSGFVKILGELVSPSQVWAQLKEDFLDDALVSDLFLVARPNLRLGHELVAFCCKQQTFEFLLKILTVWNQKAFPIHRIYKLCLLKSFPRNQMGKIDETSLKDNSFERLGILNNVDLVPQILRSE